MEYMKLNGIKIIWGLIEIVNLLWYISWYKLKNKFIDEFDNRVIHVHIGRILRKHLLSS